MRKRFCFVSVQAMNVLLFRFVNEQVMSLHFLLFRGHGTIASVIMHPVFFVFAKWNSNVVCVCQVEHQCVICLSFSFVCCVFSP